MRPTTSTMLQQNNNNNYPCLSMSGSTQEMLQNCSRAALPFPSRLELGDLPLIRGLRAWALCSKNRGMPGGFLGSRPTAPHAGRGSSTSCPKPAGVYGEWGRTRYGLPLGLDARQAETGALVTVANLKTTEGSAKTQTQCLFLQTEKGSCLYPTAKSGSGGTSSAGSSVVGGWLRGKTGGGGRDTSVGRRDIGPNPTAHTAANRVRVGSGRRWRKSGDAAGCEKVSVSRERQQRSWEDPGEITVEERKEAQDKGGPDNKQFPSPQLNKKEGVCRPPRCCHSASPKTSIQCRRRAQRRESEEHEGGESPSTGKRGVRRERQKNEEQDGGVCELGSSSVVLAAPNPDLEPNPGEPSGRDAEEIREADGNEELKGQNTHNVDNLSEQDTNSDVTKIHTGSDGPSETLTHAFNLKHVKGSSDAKSAENPCENVVISANGFSDGVEANRGLEREMQSTDVEEERRSIASMVASNCPDCVSTASVPESSAPLEGSVCTAPLGNDQVEQLEGHQMTEGEEERGESGETHTVKLNHNGNPQVFFPNEENKTSASPLTTKNPNNWRSDCQTAEPEPRHELGSDTDNEGARLNPETWNDTGENKVDDGSNKRGNDKEQRTKQEDGYEAAAENWGLQESADGCRDEKEEDGDSQTSMSRVKANGKTSTNVTNDACADPFTSPALSQANPAPPLPPLGSMATGLPRVVAAEEEAWEEEEGNNERDGVTPRDGEGGQEGTRRLGKELEEPVEGERVSTVAAGQGRREEEGEEDEFGVFVQAKAEPAWSEGFVVSASGPCGSRESVAPGSQSVSGESTRWSPGWTGGSFQRWDDSWTAFPAEPSHAGPDAVGRWWPSSAAEERRDGRSADPGGVRVFAEAFPSPPGASADPCDPGSVPTLTQLLRGRASQDQGLLDSFHDLNKMIFRRNDRAGSASRDLLLRTLRLERPRTEPRPWTANRRLSPGLPSANQHAHSAAAKRRLSYDYNRNVME